MPNLALTLTLLHSVGDSICGLLFHVSDITRIVKQSIISVIFNTTVRAITVFLSRSFMFNSKKINPTSGSVMTTRMLSL